MKSSQAATLTTPQTESQTASGYTELVLANGVDGNLLLLALKGGEPYVVAYRQQGSGWNVSGQKLPNAPNKLYTALATGTSSDNTLRLVGLGRDGQIYNPCYQKKGGQQRQPWEAGPSGALNPPGETYQEISVVTGPTNHLEVLGRAPGPQERFYRPCWLDGDTWMQGGPLPIPSSSPMFKALTATPIYSNDNPRAVIAVLTLGLGAADGYPYQSSAQYFDGSWHPSAPNALYPITRYQSLLPAHGYSNHLELLALGEDGLPYLSAWRKEVPDFRWNPGQPLFEEQDRSRRYAALLAGNGAGGLLHVVGLGRDDGKPYLVARQDAGGNWPRVVQPLPDCDPARKYHSLVMRAWPTESLQVVGLGDYGVPYLVCWQDNHGQWQPAGVPLDIVTREQVSVGTGVHIQRTLKAGDGLELILRSDMHKPLTFHVLNKAGMRTSALFEVFGDSFTVNPRKPVSLVIKQSAPNGTYNVIAEQPEQGQARRGVGDPVRCEIIVVKT